jgi:hypothetical protein
MLGTLSGALEVRGIKMPEGTISATANGTNELVNGIVQLTSVAIAYSLRIPPGSREAVDRALSRHQDKCPTAQSLKAAVAISWTADITERDAA